MPGLLVFQGKNFVFQIYYPHVIIQKDRFFVMLNTRLLLGYTLIGFEILGLGVGLGYFPKKENLHDRNRTNK